MTEKEYIERESVLKCVAEDGYDCEFDLGYWPHNAEFQELIKEIPASDVRLVVRGKWIQDDLSGIIHCSRCGNDAPVEATGPSQYKSRFCQTCGADMREEKEEGK